MKKQPSFSIKMGFLIAGIVLVSLIQFIKSSYRESLSEGAEAGFATIGSSYNSKKNASGGFSSNENLANMFVRINQGFIVTNVIQNVPNVVPHQNGALIYTYLEAAFLPRFLAPNKLKAGDQAIFMKYSGMQLNDNTSMGLGSLSDAYIDFGFFYGAVALFFYGMIFNYSLKYLYNK